MARKCNETLTEREAQIMEIVWNQGDVTADQVRESLPGDLHDSTVRTLIRILERKGYLTHDVRGKAYRYRASIKQRSAQGQALRGLITRFFGGSPESLLLRLIEDEHLTSEQLDELRRAAGPAGSSRRRRKGGAK
jgi:BlaI family transcriptional regulator, penicillinase repressor